MKNVRRREADGGICCLPCISTGHGGCMQRFFQKLYARYHPCIGARRLEKFREDTPTSPKVIEAHTLNFRPNF